MFLSFPVDNPAEGKLDCWAGQCGDGEGPGFADPLPPPPHSTAPLTLLAVCDVTLKMHDSHAVSLSMGLLCVRVCVRVCVWVYLCAQTDMLELQSDKKTHSHTDTHSCECSQALSKPKFVI